MVKCGLREKPTNIELLTMANKLKTRASNKGFWI